MKNLSTLFFATIAMLSSAAALHAQSASSSTGYPTSTTPGMTQSGQNAASKTTTPNQPYTQPSNVTSYDNSRDKQFWTWTDDEIAQKIRWAIRSERSLSTLAKSSEVSVKNNNVTLTGAVENEDEKNKIATIARQTQGVKSVSNNLTISNR